MKFKWMVILFIVYIAIMLVILFIAGKNNQTIQLLRQEVMATGQMDYSQQSSLVATKPATTVMGVSKSGITIIGKLPPEPSENKIAMQDLSSPKNIPSDTTAASAAKSAATGITKEGKFPTSKESREMNSAGIVMY